MTVFEICWIIRTTAQYVGALICLVYALHFITSCFRRFLEPRRDLDMLNPGRHQCN